MNNQSCILIDDEPHALGNLGDIIAKIPNLHEQGRYTGPIEALADLKVKGPVDFIFSDIEMPDLSGIEAAKQFRPYCKYLVFTTAHSKYALDAFGQFVDGFLLKPFGLPAVLGCVEEIRKKARNFQNEHDDPHSVFVKTGGKYSFTRIGYDDVVCIDGGDHYPVIKTLSAAVPVYMTMTELEEHFNQRKGFIRIRNNCIISMRKVIKVEGNIVYLALKNEENTREISNSYRISFFDNMRHQALIAKKSK